MNKVAFPHQKLSFHFSRMKIRPAFPSFLGLGRSRIGSSGFLFGQNRVWFSNELKQNEPKIADETEKMIFEREEEKKGGTEESAKVFRTYNIYEIRQNYSQLKNRFYMMSFSSLLQLSATLSVFYFGYPLIGCVCLWFSSGQILKTFLVFYNSRKLATRIELLEDRLHVRIFFDLRKQNYSIVAPITKVRLVHTSDHLGLMWLNKKKIAKEEEEKLSNRFYSILDVTDVKGKNHTGISVAINPENKVANFDMLQDILTANPSQMESYVYLEKKEAAKDQKESGSE